MAKKRSRWLLDLQFIEQGDIYFFYKPKKGIGKPASIQDVSRFFFVLAPANNYPARYIVMGNKMMPSINDGGRTSWGMVQMVGGRGFKTEQEDSPKVRRGASRPAGEGIYLIVVHRQHTHLLYSLELPKKPGEVQRSFNILSEANYIFLQRPVSVAPKNSEALYSNFSPVNSLQHLDQRGTEVLLVGVAADVGRLGIKAEKDRETFETADIFSKLHVDPARHPSNPLISGKWQ